MIDVSNPKLFDLALSSLQQYKSTIGRSHKGRFIQIFLGLKYYQNNIPSMFSGLFVSNEVLQTLLDDLYTKASKPLNNCVLVLFDKNYLARTGLVGLGNTGAQNTWRNNFRLQKGVGCYAPPQDLSSPTFLGESRLNCRHLNTAAPNSLQGEQPAVFVQVGLI